MVDHMADFFVAGSWRNREAIRGVLDALDAAGQSSYCFVRSTYPTRAAAVATPGGADSAPLQSDAVRAVFEQDLEALRDADRFLLVLPAGQAAHIEAGIAYGLGKRCYAVGPVERSDTLYRIFERLFAGTEELSAWLGQSAPLRGDVTAARNE